jgi:hypothetical protein
MGKMIWLMQVGLVAMLGGVILAMHYTGSAGAWAGEIDFEYFEEILLGVGVVAILAFTVIRQIFYRRKQGDGTVPAHSAARTGEDASVDPRKAISNMQALTGFANMPAVVAVGYVLVGGPLVWGLTLWAFSMIAILTIKPLR